MEDAWIKLYAKFLKWEWFQNSYMVHLFLYLLLEANYEDKKWMGRTIYRGQLVTSISRLSDATGLSIKQIRTCLDRLQQTGEITKKSTNKWTIITVSNYESYQQVPSDNGQARGKQGASQGQHLQTIYNPIDNIDNRDIHKDKDIDIDISTPHTQAYAYTREDWRHLSSARKFSLGNNPDRIAGFKRTLIANELSEIAAEIQMPKEAQEKFLTKWCEHNPGSATIKAEFEPTFNVRDRAIQWMGWWNSKEKPKQEKQSSFDYYKDLMNTMNSRFGNEQQESDTGIPDEQ